MKSLIKLIFILFVLTIASCNDKIESTQSNCLYCEEPVYQEKFSNKIPTDLIIYYEYDQGVRCAKAQNKPIFLTFTGHGAISNKDGYFWYWVTNINIHNILKDKYIVIALFVDDKSPLEEHEIYKSENLDREINTIGWRNSDLQSTRFGVNSQPFSIILDSDGNVLTKPLHYEASQSKILEYLEKGIVVFTKKPCKQNHVLIIFLIITLVLCLIVILILLHLLKKTVGTKKSLANFHDDDDKDKRVITAP